MNPRVTVLMTLYNKGPYVEAAIRSILEGTYGDLELLVVDDASTDDGPSRVSAMRDQRIRLITLGSNGGRAVAANCGYDAARGEYIAVLDADDIAHPRRLELQVAFMDDHPEVGISGTGARCFGGEEKEYQWPSTDRGCRGQLLFSDPVLYGSSIIRRSVLVEHGLRSNEEWLLPGEDYLLLLQFSKVTRFANLPEILLEYRIGVQNQRHGRNAYDDRKAVCRAVFDFFELEASEEQLDLHMLFYLLTRKPVTSSRVRAFRKWIDHLARLNREEQLFPVPEFEVEMETRWRRFFHMLPEHGVGPALEYMRLSGDRSLPRWTYLLKVTGRRWLGLLDRG